MRSLKEGSSSSASDSEASSSDAAAASLLPTLGKSYAGAAAGS